MAWPATPLATFVNNSSPPCDATFLNNLQSGVTGLTTGAYSFAAITCDGTGGAAVTPVSGAVKVSAAVSGTSAPTTTVTKGVIYKETPAIAMGSIQNNGAASLIWGIGVSAVGFTATGKTTVALTTPLSSSSSGIVLVTGNDTGAGPCLGFLQGSPANSVTVWTVNGAGSLSNFNYSFVVYGS